MLPPRIDNAVFFGTSASAPRVAYVPEAVFYGGRLRPPPETPILERAAATPVRFALVIFLAGWAGIFFQRSFLQQIVFGAPVFEELAKFGPPLLIVSIFGIRTLWIRLPLAWASGAAFGVFEHTTTYASEDVYLYAGRVVFHAAAPGLSMILWGAFEDSIDIRARWAATVPATLFHWANNFAALVLGIGGVFLHALESVALVWSATVTVSLVVVTIVALAARPRFEAAARRILDAAMPRIGLRR